MKVPVPSSVSTVTVMESLGSCRFRSLLISRHLVSFLNEFPAQFAGTLPRLLLPIALGIAGALDDCFAP